MRQTTMDRWIEAAEARRVFQIAQEEWTQPPAPTPLPDSHPTRLPSMVFNPQQKLLDELLYSGLF